MAIEALRSTRPDSSRLTISSSSRSAVSKSRSPTGVSLIIATPLRCDLAAFAGAAQQRLHVGADRTRQAGEVIAAFEHGHHPPAGPPVGNVHELERHPGE